MGCGIHLFAEIKATATGAWHLYDQIDFPRNYAVFEKMAGVRGEVQNAIAGPRGLPLDVSPTVLIEYRYYGEDAHTASWLSRAEGCQLIEWIERELRPNRFPVLFDHFDFEWETRSFFFGNSYRKFVPGENPRLREVADWRFVFWFDN